MKMASVASFIREQRIQWLGHMQRKNEDDINRVVLEWKPTGNRPRGRPRKIWLDVVEEDLGRIGFENGENQRGIEKEGFSDGGENPQRVLRAR